MDRRRLIIVGMWVAALAAIAAIYLTVEPDGGDGRTRGAGESPVFVAAEDLASRQERAQLPVAAELGSPRLYRGGPRHTGRSPYRGPSRPVRLWRYQTGGRITAQPVVDGDGDVYVGSHDRRLHAVSGSGQPLWTAPMGDRVWSAAAVREDGTVLVGSDADALFALAPRDGSVRWRLRGAGDVDGPVTVDAEGRAWLTAGRYLYAIDSGGAVRWRFAARGPFLLMGPAMDSDGTLYAASIDDHLYAVAPDGRMRWDYRAGADISSSPVIGDDGTIFFGSDDRSVHAVSRDGERRWRADVEGYVRAPVALGRHGDVLVGVYGPRARLVSLDAQDGSVRWFFPVTASTSAELGVTSGPLVDADGHIYFGAHDDYVYSVTPQGDLRWIHQTGGDVDSAPVLRPDGVLLVGSDDGYLYAIGERPAQLDGGAAADGGSPPDGGRAMPAASETASAAPPVAEAEEAAGGAAEGERESGGRAGDHP